MLVIDVGPKTGDWARSVLRMLPTMNVPLYYCAIGPPDEVRWTEHSAKTLAQDLFLDGSLKIAGFEPLSEDYDQNQAVDIPLLALQICGLKDGQLIELADYHRWERSSAVAESFETLHERWKASQQWNNNTNSGCPRRHRKGGEAKIVRAPGRKFIHTLVVLPRLSRQDRSPKSVLEPCPGESSRMWP